MYLKKIDIQGFKSFADKTEVSFNDRITAIVGPNGSGKSNIADAIRWVLGEQSVKSLRGNKMEDVIFSGTEKRKALGYSEVSISFDNNEGKIPLDYREVVVTRRMFRSGESEYYINKNSARLKDVRELFMDTGIGKEGYSIIGQGKIDEILSNKPEDRRNIFEEAAGIVKYKAKKQEALRKLERTTMNLIRIGDLLLEIKLQKDSLKLESDKAIEFQGLFNKLKNIDVNIAVMDIDKMNKKVEVIEEKQVALNKEKEIIDADNALSDEHYLELKTELNSLEKEIEDKRALKLENIQTLEKNKTELRIIKEQSIYLNKEINRLEDNLKTYLVQEEEGKDFKLPNEELNLLIENKEKFVLSHREKLSQRNEVLEDLKDLDKTSSLLKNQIMTLYNEVSDKKSELNSISLYIDNINKGDKKINLDLVELESKKETTLSLVQEKEKDLNKEKRVLEDLIEKEHSLSNKLEVLADETKRINKLLTDKENDLSNNKSSIKLYKNMESQYEGYYQSVKDIIKALSFNSELNKGFIGLVADLFEVDKAYLRAVEIALGSSIQNIVVLDDQAAKSFIEYLKKEKKGRATFLPLNTIRPSSLSISEKVKNDYGILGSADELIKYDVKYENIFKNLLGRTLVAKDINSAIGYARTTNFKARLVTLDGEVVNPGGSLTGGSFKNTNISILNRKNIIKDLTNTIKDINSSIIEFKVEEELKNKEYKNITINLNQLKIKQEEVKNNIRSLENQIKNDFIDLGRIDDDIRKIKLDQDNFKKEFNNLRQKETMLKKEIEDMKIKMDEFNLKEKESESQLQLLKDKKENLDREITELLIEITKLNATIDEKNRSIVKNKEDLEGLREKINFIKLEIINQNNILNENNKKSKVISDSLEEFSHSESSQADDLNELLSVKNKKMNKFYEYGEKLKVYNNRLTNLERDINKLEIEKTKATMHIETMTEKLINDYDLDYKKALAYTFEIKDIKEAKNSILELKAKIKSLGNINISSIEEYKSVSERYEFLSKQLSDLNIAKEDIENVIKDIDRKMRLSFRKAFDQINIKFAETFSALFNGGKARLEITEGEDILSAGIEIMAQPPGKKLQSLTLLSGGEKSLTAVALLFAILKIKPAPFCILDEIDAALDEANITRYTDYLQSLDNKTQFVLITHRKTTMEIADVLYGVTMEEDGISKLLSLKLKDFNEIAI